MRHPAAFVLVLSLLAPVAAHGEAPTLSPPPAVPLDAKRPSLQVTIDRSKVDLAGHKLEVKLSRPAEKVTLKVIGQSGAILAEVEKKFGGASAGTVLTLSWTPSSDEVVARIEVRGFDTDGYWSGVAIIPWKISIPHEELNFDTDSDVIRSAEAPKLQASLKLIQDALAKHKDLGQITLYVVGHTDTVGTPEHNITLSRRRARSIGAWFRANGLKIPVAFEGMGESMPLVKTADNVDEQKNRRADYILALEPPRLPSGEVAWKSL